jgi:hypothetical protein
VVNLQSDAVLAKIFAGYPRCRVACALGSVVGGEDRSVKKYQFGPVDPPWSMPSCPATVERCGSCC